MNYWSQFERLQLLAGCHVDTRIDMFTRRVDRTGTSRNALRFSAIR